MAQYGSADVGFFLVGGRNLRASVIERFTADIESVMAPAHGLGDAWQASKATGNLMASLQQQGLFDDAAGGIKDAMVGAQTTQQIVCYSLAGNVAGREGIGCLGAFGSKLGRQVQRGALQQATVDYTVTGQVDSGVILGTQTTRGAAGNTEGAPIDDNAAASSNGAVAYLQIPQLTLGGFTNVIIKVRHSTNGTTFTDLLTFTAVTAAPAAQRVTVAGTINRYLAFSWAYTGAGSGQSVTPVVVLDRL